MSAPRIIAELMVSPWIVRRKLVDAELFSRCPAKKPLISARNKVAKLEFAG